MDNDAALLTERWRDVLSLGGLALALVGFLVTYWQIRKARSAAQAAANAANQALEESRLAYQKLTTAYCHRFINEAKIHVDSGAWEKAASRLNDLAD